MVFATMLQFEPIRKTIPPKISRSAPKKRRTDLAQITSARMLKWFSPVLEFAAVTVENCFPVKSWFRLECVLVSERREDERI